MVFKDISSLIFPTLPHSSHKAGPQAWGPPRLSQQCSANSLSVAVIKHNERRSMVPEGEGSMVLEWRHGSKEQSEQQERKLNVGEAFSQSLSLQ